MARTILKVILGLYALYALIKFCDFFYLSYTRRRAGLAIAYAKEGRAIKRFDAAMLVLVIIILALAIMSGVDHLSFGAGLLVGMTLIQVYFHRFIDVLPPDKQPEPPVSALKLMSYSIQAHPAKGWREMLIITILLLWFLSGLLGMDWGAIEAAIRDK